MFRKLYSTSLSKVSKKTKIPAAPIKANHLQDGAFPSEGHPMNSTGTLLENRLSFLRTIAINSPRTHNRINLDISSPLLQRLKQFNYSDKILGVLMKGNGNAATSFGHDFAALEHHINSGDKYSAASFLKTNYKTISFLANCEKPIAFFLNGSVVSAGAGICCYTDFVVGNEETKFSAPDIFYGFIPDGGNTYLLKEVDRAYPGLGMFLALTGSVVKGIDLYHLDLVTHIGSSANLELLMQRVADLIFVATTDVLPLDSRTNTAQTTSHALLEQVIRDNCDNIETFPKGLSFAQDLPLMKTFFTGKNSVNEIITNLEEALQKEEYKVETYRLWIESTLKALKQASPLSLRLTFALMKNSIQQNSSLDECLNNEFRVAVKLLEENDFKQGMDYLIRQNQPQQWSSQSLSSQELDTKVQQIISEPLDVQQHGIVDIALPYDVFHEDLIKRQINSWEKRQ